MRSIILFVILTMLTPCLIYASLEVHFVDVGQGDSIIINADGHYGIIDGGPSTKSQSLYSYIKKMGIASFELIVISHTDSDHVGGIVSAVEAAGIAKNCTIWCNDLVSEQRQFTAFKSRVAASGCRIVDPVVGTTIFLGNAKITVIGPIRKTGRRNDDSIVVKLEYAGKSFLFMGDAERMEENSLINEYSPALTEFGKYPSTILNADVLKVGHHGSDNSATQYFLNYVRPSISVISVGINNRNGHPTENTLSRLEQAGSDIYRTDVHGTIKICVNDNGSLTVVGQKSSTPWFDENLLSSQQRNDLSSY